MGPGVFAVMILVTGSSRGAILSIIAFFVIGGLLLAVSTTLALAEARGDTRPFKGLINGVLRGLLREPPVFDPETLAPAWLFARWRAAYGGETAQALAAAITQGWLAEDALIVWEESADITPPKGLTQIDERRYGDTVIRLLEYTLP